MTQIVISALCGLLVGVGGTLIWQSKAIALGNKLLTLAENDYDAALNHVYTFLRLKK